MSGASMSRADDFFRQAIRSLAYVKFNPMHLLISAALPDPLIDLSTASVRIIKWWLLVSGAEKVF